LNGQFEDCYCKNQKIKSMEKWNDEKMRRMDSGGGGNGNRNLATII
jgi:hypothetical protein